MLPLITRKSFRFRVGVFANLCLTISIQDQ
jgi:hypothetical protein